jgi:O-antigen ligase
MIQKHPITGVGYQQFGMNSLSYLNQAPGMTHNIFLLIAAETGLISLLAFLGWIGLIFWAAWRSAPLPETGLLFAAFIGFLFIGCCDFYPIFFQQGKLLFFGTAGLLARFACFSRKQA